MRIDTRENTVHSSGRTAPELSELCRSPSGRSPGRVEHRRQQQAQTEASTVVIKAKGEAESIVLRGKALRENPSVLELQIIEHWDGVTPLVVGPGATGANMMLPLGDFTTDAKPQTNEEGKP